MKRYLFLILLLGCAGMSRQCSSCNAGNFGADWLVVQYRYDGTVMKCWRLPDVSMSNEEGSDGIYWESPDGHLVHLSGWYNRVQVKNKHCDSAAKAAAIDLSSCSLEVP